MVTLLALAALARIAKINIHGKATKILLRVLAIIVIVPMARIAYLDNAQGPPDYIFSWSSYPAVDFVTCQNECNKYYGFRIYRLRTWPIRGVGPLEECYDRCRCKGYP